MTDHYQSTYTTIKDKLETKMVTHIGTPTVPYLRKLEELAAEAAAAVTYSSSDIPGSNRLGLLAIVIPPSQYIHLANPSLAADNQLDDTWTLTPQTDPGPYDPAAAVNANASQRAQQEAQHKLKQDQYAKYNGAQDAIKDTIVASVPTDSIITLKEKFIGYKNRTIHDMFIHLRAHAVQVQSTTDVDEMYNTLSEPWDGDNIATFLKRQKDYQESLTNAGVDCPESLLVTRTVKQIFNTGLFNEDEVTQWEEKPTAAKTWAGMTTYFTKIHIGRKRYRKNITAGSLGYSNNEQVNSMREREEIENLHNQVGQVNELLCQLIAGNLGNNPPTQPVAAATTTALPSDLATQLAAMATTVATLTTEIQNIKKNGTSGSNSNGGNNGGGGSNGNKKSEKHKCPTCGLMVRHKETNCPDLPENTHKRWAGWKNKTERIAAGEQSA